MRARQATWTALATTLAFGPGGCSQVDTSANVELRDAIATLHAGAEGVVADGTVNLHVSTHNSETRAWLVTLNLYKGQLPFDSSDPMPLPGVTVEPVSSFPLRVEANSEGSGTVHFRAPYPLESGLPVSCAGHGLWLDGTTFDTASEKFLEEPGATQILFPLQVALTFEGSWCL